MLELDVVGSCNGRGNEGPIRRREGPIWGRSPIDFGDDNSYIFGTRLSCRVPNYYLTLARS